MAKKCPGCGDEFVGLEPLCPVCRRRPRADPIREGTSNPKTAGLPKTDEYYDDGVCPTCGQRTRPMTNAERQKRWREKNRKDTA